MSGPRFTMADGHALRRQLAGRAMASGLMCPVCHGGRSGERSVTARVTGLSLSASCWRNKCGAWGKWGPDEVETGPTVDTFRRKAYDPETLPLSDACIADVEGRYAVHSRTLVALGVRMMAGAAALYVPVRNPLGESRGWARRRLDGLSPKAAGLPNAHHQGAWLAWFPRSPVGRVVAVEDVLSAMRLWQEGWNAVALLGTSLSGGKVSELRRFSQDVVVALDADAAHRAIGHGLNYDLHVRRLSLDIKDMTKEQLTQWLTSLSSSLPPLGTATLAS
jgi:hypothetical protein